MCGAWVGGEYRSIHFRTGALGQGSKTALPICGYFLESVMNDPAFKQYHGRFSKSTDSDITDALYNCSSYVPSRNDTLDVDSIDYMEDEVILDEEGNPVSTSGDVIDALEEPQATKERKKETPKEQPVSFDDL